jgi:hypothetical protein
MKLSNLVTTPDIFEGIYAERMSMGENSDVPVPGDTIRTPKLEGKVSKVEEGYVYFTTADGRNMRNSVENCTVIEKLADQECSMCEDEQIDEVSTELLAKYKTAAGKDASASDKKGDYARGNKRFSGIVKATKKQFDNDAKKKTDEGSMGGINRSAPSNDVSYEKVLDEVYGKWDEEQVNELSVGKLQAYKDAAKSPESFRNRPLRKLARTIQGVKDANTRIDTKTGNRRPAPGPERGNNESIDANEDITPWGGYTADDPKANALAKAPKSSMQGKGDVRFSELVQDAIKAHGVKWAFDYYVKKHGLPPRQFQIFAGLTAKPRAVEPAKTDWADPSTTSKPTKPQSWWQKLRGKLPFEE